VPSADSPKGIDMDIKITCSCCYAEKLTCESVGFFENLFTCNLTCDACGFITKMEIEGGEIFLRPMKGRKQPIGIVLHNFWK